MAVVMDIVKKNLLSIVCALIAILAIFADFWPLGGMREALQGRLNERVQEASTLDGLLKKERHFPITQPEMTAPQKLEQFPTPVLIEKANSVAAEIKKQASGVLELSNSLNQHQLLVPGSLPNPTRSLQIKFRDEYQKQVDYLNPDPAVRNQSMIRRILRAGMPPTDAEILAERQAQETQITNEKLIPGANGNQAQVTEEINQMALTLPAEMKGKVAQESLMYVNADSGDVFPGIIDTNNPPPGVAMYFGQIGLWVQQDVFNALAAANAGASDVMQSPVKHLVKIEVDETAGHGHVQIPTGGPQFGGTSFQPPPPPQDGGAPPPDAGATLGRAATATGRASNASYEVIPFRLVINVDASQIPQVLTELSRNRFITILNTNITAVDSGTAALNGYYYGGAQVVQLALEGEVLFLKSWLSKYMPPAIAGPAAPAPPPGG